MYSSALKEINEQLLLLEEKLREKNILERKQSELHNELSDKLREIKEFRTILSKEEKDVEKLEKASLTNFITTILGSKSEKLDKEKREYIDAKLKMDRLNSEHEMLKDDIADYKNKLYDYRLISSDIAKVKQHKLELLKNHDPAFKEEYQEMMREVSISKEQIIEIKEALKEGRRCSSTLQEAYNSLRKAKNLGTWDIILNDSLFTSIAKHNQIDSANHLISRAKAHLRRFNNELKDVNMSTSIQGVSVSNVDKTFDIWFDNIFSDFNTQSKINNSLTSVERSLSGVKRAIRKLETIKNEHENKEMTIKRKLDKLLSPTLTR